MYCIVGSVVSQRETWGVEGITLCVVLCYRFSGLTERDLGVEGITLCVLCYRFSGLTERDLWGRRYHPLCIVL